VITETDFSEISDCVKMCEDWLLHHDNAPYRATFFTREFLTENMTIVSYPPYSPDQAYSYISVFLVEDTAVFI
jgi:hypothetical protein